MRISVGLTLLLGLLAAVGPISTDIYLPAFSLIDRDFGRIGGAQMTLAAWFVGLAIGQMVQGPLSDRLGRRIPLLYGTLFYTAASIGCAVAPTLGSFSTFRLLAAVGGSAGMVIPRALIRDVSEGFGTAKALSRLTLVLGVVPILAPALGGMMMIVFSWRDLFWFAAIYGVVCTVLVWRFLPDTLPMERRVRHGLFQMLNRYRQIAVEPVFLANALQISFAFAGLFTYIGGSASVYTGYFHLTPQQYGVLFGINACSFIAATQVAPRLAARFGMHAMLHFSARMLLASYGLAAIAAFLHLGLVAMAVPIFFGQFGYGLLSPLTIVSALTPHRAHAGSASALLGTLQYALGAVFGALIGLISDGTPIPMVLLMVLCAGVVVLVDTFRPSVAFDS